MHHDNTEARYGYNTLASMQAAVARMREFDIPQDAQWGDIDIMERSLDFTVSQTRFGGLPDYVRQLKGEGVRFVTILDPCISTGEPNNTYRPFDLGQELDVWVQLPGEGDCSREVLMGVGDGVASVIMLTFTKRPGPHADFYSEARPPC